MAPGTQPNDTTDGTGDETNGLTNVRWFLIICTAVLFFPIAIGLAVGWNIRGIADTLADSRIGGHLHGISAGGGAVAGVAASLYILVPLALVFGGAGGEPNTAGASDSTAPAASPTPEAPETSMMASQIHSKAGHMRVQHTKAATRTDGDYAQMTLRTASTEQGELARDIGFVAGAYANWVAAHPRPPDRLEVELQVPGGQTIGWFTVQTEWVQAHNDGEMSSSEVVIEVGQTIETA